MKNRFLFLLLLLSFVLIFSCNVAAAVDFPSDIEFKLSQYDTGSLSVYPTEQTFEWVDPEGMLQFDATVYYIEVPKGTTEIVASGADIYDRLNVKNIGTDDVETFYTDPPWGRLINEPFPVKTTLDDCYLLWVDTDWDVFPFKAYSFVLYFVEVAQPSVQSMYVSSDASYVGNNLTLTVGAEFEDAEKDTPVKFYITDKENGTSEDAVAGTLQETTAGNVTFDSADVCVPTGELEAGQYWLAVEVGDSRMYQPFTMYATKEAYIEVYPQYTDEGQVLANQLKALPEEIIDAEDIEAVNEAREAYEAFMADLPDKADVESVESYYAELEAALSEAEEACVAFVESAVSALPAADEISLEDEEAITAARAAYDALSDVQKEQTAAETLTALEAAEAALEDLLKPGENPFVDVPEKEFFYEPVLWAYYHDPQITKGTDDTHFSPAGTCTRGQVVTFLWRAMGEPEPTLTKNPFKDVVKGQYYYKAVLWAVEKGITTGTSKDTFSPNGNCTRAQVVTFLWRTEEQPEPQTAQNPFSDVKASDYFCKAVLWAVENNITTGTGNGKFSPAAACTRGQVVTFLFRAQ